MAKTIGFLVLAVFIGCGTLTAQNSGFGLGVILGEPTGLSGKLWVGTTSAIDGAAAWSLGKRSTLHLHLDYLFHHFDLLKVQTGKLPFYYGIGGRIKFRENNRDEVGIRIPIGINYLFAKVPLDTFLEIVPLLDLIPSTDFDLNAGIGIRYFFR